MKKSVLKGILILLSITTITGCSNIGVQNVQNKTEFKVNEEAFVDHFQITCTKYEQIANTLKVNYIVTNNSNENTKISLQTDFKLVVTDTEFINSSSNGTILLNASETKEIIVSFDLNGTMSKPYTVLFYSNVVSNNIGFILD